MHKFITVSILLITFQPTLTRAQTNNKSGLSSINHQQLNNHIVRELTKHRKLNNCPLAQLKIDTVLNKVAEFQALYICNNDIRITHEDTINSEFSSVHKRVGTLEGFEINNYNTGEVINDIPNEPSNYELSKSIITSFRKSPPHWSLLMNKNLTHLGVYSLQRKNGRVVTVIVLAEAYKDDERINYPTSPQANLDSVNYCLQLEKTCDSIVESTRANPANDGWAIVNEAIDNYPECKLVQDDGLCNSTLKLHRYHLFLKELDRRRKAYATLK